MFGKKKNDVVIIGAGPVGLLSALMLGKAGLNVQIIDKDWQRATHSYGLAIHANTLELFEKLGLLKPVLETAYKVNKIGFYDGRERKTELDYGKLNSIYPYIAVMQQNTLEELLEDAVKKQGIKVDWHHRLAHIEPLEPHTDVIINKLEKESLGYIISRMEQVVAKSIRQQVPFVIGCDGHHSLIRRSLDLDFNTVAETETFAVFEFKSDADLQNEMRIVLDGKTKNVLWPLPDGNCRWSFQLLDYEAAGESREKDHSDLNITKARYPMLSEEKLHELIAERAPWFKGSVDHINWRIVVRFEHRLVNSFGMNRVWLAGDSAHLTGPVGVLSMNYGFQEAQDLAERIVKVVKNGESIDQLQEYNTKWLDTWKKLHGVSHKIKAGSQTDPWLKQYKDGLLPCIPTSTESDLVNLLSQLGLEI